MGRRTGLLFLALLPAGLVATELARAQSENVTTSGQLVPDRYVNGAFLGSSTRPQNMTPLGVNYNDCTQDMVLRFNLAVSGFTGADSLQIWATKSGDCTQSTARGVGANAVTTCWIVGPSSWLTGQVISATKTVSFDIRVQDIVGLQNAPPSPPTYVMQGPSACNAQTSFVAVPIIIYFVPVDSGLNTVGTPYKYTLTTDLVGPQAPAISMPGFGETLFVVNWTPNIDSDTNGYDVFLYPIPGMEDAAAVPVDAAANTMLVCPDTAPPATLDDATGATLGAPIGEAGDDGSSSDATTPNFDGCVNAPVISDSGSSSCFSTVLTGAIVQDGGGVVPTDDAGNPIEGGVPSGNGGISTIPSAYLISTNASGATVSDKNTGTYQITGLQNGQTYTAVVSAVDGSGNVGPPSIEVCGKPQPVDDFWKIYRQDGGLAGGGCALGAAGESVPAVSGIALIAATSALVRRRRRVRRGARGS